MRVDLPRATRGGHRGREGLGLGSPASTCSRARTARRSSDQQSPGLEGIERTSGVDVAGRSSCTPSASSSGAGSGARVGRTRPSTPRRAPAPARAGRPDARRVARRARQRGAHPAPPGGRNALDLALRRLACTLENLANDREVRTVVLTGAGGACSRPAAISPSSRPHVEPTPWMSELGYQVTTAVSGCPCPWSPCSGPTVGGGAGSLACDVRIAEPAATWASGTRAWP